MTQTDLLKLSKKKTKSTRKTKKLKKPRSRKNNGVIIVKIDIKLILKS